MTTILLVRHGLTGGIGVRLHYLGIPIDLYARLETAPASVSVLELTPDAIRLLRFNDTGRRLATDR